MVDIQDLVNTNQELSNLVAEQQLTLKRLQNHINIIIPHLVSYVNNYRPELIDSEGYINLEEASVEPIKEKKAVKDKSAETKN